MTPAIWRIVLLVALFLPHVLALAVVPLLLPELEEPGKVLVTPFSRFAGFSIRRKLHVDSERERVADGSLLMDPVQAVNFGSGI